MELRRDRRGLLAAHGGAKMRFRWAAPVPATARGLEGRVTEVAEQWPAGEDRPGPRRTPCSG